MGRATILVAALLAACSSNSKSLHVDAKCNPLGLSHCLVPWPSSAYEVDDTSTATGRRLQIPDGAMPTNIDGIAVDPSGWNTADGFSAAAPMVMAFPGGVSTDGLPPQDHMDLSTAADSPTLILDLATGERIAHFAEIDAQAADQPDSQALFLRPAARLQGGHRYAAVITNKVKAADGGELPVSPGFVALRDGKPTDHALLEAMRPRFADVRAAIEAAGVSLDDVVVAWDFTVASDAYVHRDMVAARDRALAALQSHPIAVTIATDAQVGDGSIIKRRITGTLDAPLFLANHGAAQPGTKIVRDADGLPTVQGFYQIPFSAIVPTCAYSASAKVGMILYGHGLLGDSTEATGGVQQTTANELCMVIVGTDMRGMAEIDLPAVARALNDLSKADEVMEVLEQGMVNHITLTKALRTTFASTIFVDGGGASLVDPDKVYYYGLSQGAIMGTGVMAWEPTILRGVLGVGAANYSMLLDRSADWPTYRTVLAGAYPDALDVTMGVSLFQMRWDKTEGAGVTHTVLTGNEGNPPKQLLLQIALSDEQVPNVGSYWWARTMKVPVLGPTPAQPWGLPVQATPLAAGASGLVIMDGGAPPAPTTNLPAPSVEPSMHDLTRTQPATRRQMKQFYATGTIVNECSGACVCQSHQCD